MKEVGSRYQVSDTAALVMLWAQEYYQNNPLIRAYLGMLDLSSGKDLIEHYNQICPWYSEVIVNRKHFIRHIVEALIGCVRDSTTIVNLGAGFSPLALELVHHLSPTHHIIEIDESGMNHKHALYSRLIPDRCEFISFIEADITNISSLKDALEEAQSTHLIVVMEGITYYINRSVMGQIFSILPRLTVDLSIVFEHLKPCQLISEQRRPIPYRIFSHLQDHVTLDRITTYTPGEIGMMLPQGFSSRYYHMSDMERRRTGTGTYFPTPDAGWLSCAVIKRKQAGN